MKRISLWKGGALGGFTALTVIALTYLAERFAGLPFLPFDIFDWTTRNLPGGFITFSIDTMVRLISSLNVGPTSAVAKQIEQSIAIVIFTFLGIIFGIVLAAIGRRNPGRLTIVGAVIGLFLSIPVVFIEISLGPARVGMFIMILWAVLVFVAWGVTLSRLVLSISPAAYEAAEPGMSRREFLYLVGAGSFTIMVTALGVSVLGQRKTGTSPGKEAETIIEAGKTSGPAASPPQPVLEARLPPVPGTRPELTSNENFYRIDINTLPPEVDASTWKLEVDGLVDQPLSLTLDDLRSRSSYGQVITLSCISNQIGGDLISTGLWTGVRLKDILNEAGLRRGVQEIAMESVDGFYESLPLDEAMDDRTLLVYEMNGEPLPVAHGFPLRIYIPGHYGMKQPKWLKHLQAIDHAGAGYWVERGWSATAVPKTTSVIDTVAVEAGDPDTGMIPVGGIAYAGARGISKVEVQVDDGPWKEAELRDPPLSQLTWVQWRFLWNAEMGRHTFRVRAYDGTGALQETQPSPPHPNGATGIDEVTQTI
jgi:DMSO/TMAO reductase YedYZ molybdopterin-dependent catalytic subunit